MLLVASLATVPMAAGDGIPGYKFADIEGLPEHEVFSSIFESRQLARVDLLNDTHQRISLFLSVFSMDPGRNMTIMVPLRTLPADVTGEPRKESEFREEYGLDRAEDEVVRQDPDEAWGRLRKDTGHAFQLCFGSMVLTLPGEYLRETVHDVGTGTAGYKDSGTEGMSVIGEPEPIQHYEFDGFSIDVFGVGAGPLLEDYLEEKGLVIPEGGGLDRYEGQYLAVIEGESKPPIDEETFMTLTTYVPNSTAVIVEELREDPKRDAEGIWKLKDDMSDRIISEYYKHDDPPVTTRSLSAMGGELIDALFGSTNFEGEVIHVDLPLDGDRMFFPLGTSAGWPNQVGDIDILFSVPEDRDLELPSAKDAFFNDRHFYLFQMQQANPSFDLETPLKDGDEARRKEAERAAWLYDNSEVLGYLIVVGLTLLVWFGCALILVRKYELEGGCLRNRRLWLLLGLSFLISIPGALLVYLMAYPVNAKELLTRVTPTTPILMYPLAMLAFIAGGLL